MSPSLHSPDQLREFLGAGEPRLIMSAYKDQARRGELFVMEDGQAKNLYEFTRNELRCFFEDCPQPGLKAVSRQNARDGFSHLSGGQKHAPESINHEQGKVIIAEWLRRRYPAAKTDIEVPIDAARTRIADVLTIGTQGGKIAFEIQCAALSFAEWQKRHQDYRERGIVDLWLFGHVGDQFRRSRASKGSDVQLNLIQRSLAQQKQPVFWFNPELQQIATAYTRVDGLAVAPRHEAASLRVLSLDRFELRPDGLFSQFLGELARNEESVKLCEARREKWKRETEEARCEEQAKKEAARKTKQKPLRVSWLQRQKSLAGLRAAQARETQAQRERAVAEAAKREVDRRIRHVVAGKLVYCPNCWYRLTTVDEARVGAHANCVAPN
jgi:hypothetical protein